MGEGAAFQVLDGLDLFGDLQRLLVADWLRTHVAQVRLGRLVVSKVEFGANKNDWNIWSMVVDFGVPLQESQNMEI